jgi:hypothetical protein
MHMTKSMWKPGCLLWMISCNMRSIAEPWMQYTRTLILQNFCDWHSLLHVHRKMNPMAARFNQIPGCFENSLDTKGLLQAKNQVIPLRHQQDGPPLTWCLAQHRQLHLRWVLSTNAAAYPELAPSQIPDL